MKGIYKNLPGEITHPYTSSFYKRFTCGDRFGGDTCDIICDTLQDTFVIQFIKKEEPHQRIVISKDLLLNIPFELVIKLISDNYHNIIQFGVRDFLMPTRAVNALFEDFSSININIGTISASAVLTAEQTIAVLALHIDKLYIDSYSKVSIRKALNEIAKSYL